MSLATTCPQCRTSFKVVPDQLKLRRGQVRCGVCRHVFSGLDTLRYVQAEGASDPAAPSAISPGASASIDVQTQPDPFIDIESIARLGEPDPGDHEVGPAPVSRGQVDTASGRDAPGSGTEDQTVHAPESAPETVPELKTTPEPETTPELKTTPELETTPEPETVPELETLFGPNTVTAPLPDAAAPVLAAHGIATPRTRPDAEHAHADDETDAVDFFSTRDRARGFSTRATLLWALMSILLAALLAAQAAIGTRDWLASRYPTMRPAIAAAVSPLGLEIAAPRALDALTIEGFELQSTAVPGLYAMNALLRNGSVHEVRWPAMELTLNDQAGAVVVRKVLLPADYLPGASLRSATDPARAGAGDGGANPPAPSSTGIKPAAEIALRTALAASDVAPTGYTVKLFYP